MKAIFLALSLPLMAQVPASYRGTSNGWDPFHGDKAQHVMAGAFIGIAPYYTAKALGYKHPWVHSIFWAILAGVIKENYDRHHGGRPEYADVIYTGLGGFTVGFTLYKSDQHKKEFAGIPKDLRHGD